MREWRARLAGIKEGIAIRRGGFDSAGLIRPMLFRGDDPWHRMWIPLESIQLEFVDPPPYTLIKGTYEAGGNQ